MKRKEFSTNDNESSNDSFKRKEKAILTLVLHVFGLESFKTICSITDKISGGINKQDIFQNINVWITRTLDEIQPSLATSVEDRRPGRLGVPKVVFDTSVMWGRMVMSEDRHHARALSNLSTLRANVCCFSGKWQYELQVESTGVIQVGWTLNEDKFSTEAGVGDSVYSFAYDGNRIRKWNLVATEYGEAWQTGDIIGCTIVLDIGSIHFYRNGRDLGEAFSSIPLGPGCVYFPAISLAYEQSLGFNFGYMPFKYPVQSFSPLQQPPTGAVLRTNKLLQWMSLISSWPTQQHLLKGQVSNVTKVSPTPEALKLMFCELLVKHLSEFIGKIYIIDACIVPFLHDANYTNLNKISLPSRRSLEKVDLFYDSLSLQMEPDDFTKVVNAICQCLVLKFDQTPVSLDFDKQKQSLAVFSVMCQNHCVRKTLLRQRRFLKSRLPVFMDLKPLDLKILRNYIPNPWWESEAHQEENFIEYQLRKQSYFAKCENIKHKTLELEHLQEEILIQLLNNNDGTTSEPSSMNYFLHAFRLFVKDNYVPGWNNVDEVLIPPPIALSFFYRIVNVVKCLWEREFPMQPLFVPISTFYKGLVNYSSIERLGGLLSHLVRTHRTSLVAELGENHTVLTTPTPSTSAQPTVGIQMGEVGRNSGELSAGSCSNNIPAVGEASKVPDCYSVSSNYKTHADSLIELFDGAVMFYNSAPLKHLNQISTIRRKMDKYKVALNEAKQKQKLAQVTCPKAMAQIQISIQAFEKHITEHSQMFMAWVRGTVYTPEKRSNLIWLLNAVLITLEEASERGDMFGFVPEHYVDAVVNLCSALKNDFSPTLPLVKLPGYRGLLLQVAEFLTRHFSDPRIVNPHSKDVITEEVANFLIKKQTLECLEKISVPSQEIFVRALLRPFESQAWGQCHWILMRIWLGSGFASRLKTSPHHNSMFGPHTKKHESLRFSPTAFEPCPSAHYQQLVCRTLTQNQKVADEFLNSALKQLNWLFSEFISTLQEIQKVSKKPTRVIIDTRQLQMCYTFYDLVIALMRVFEMLCSICPHVFTESFLERLSQLLNQILLRVTTSSGTFSYVISIGIPDLESIEEFSILAALAGILIALLAKDLSQGDNVKIENMSLSAKCLLLEPSFNIERLKYLLGEYENGDTPKVKRFSFEDYPEDVSATEVQSIRKMISVLTIYKANMSMSKDLDEEEICPICCAMKLAVTFMPCQHQSCKSCITHYLTDCKNCFFCKADILSVVSEDGTVLFDFNVPSVPE